MANHSHVHEEDTYFLDQLCMVALSGAFGAICLAMYFVQQGMLYRLLGPQFHPFVLASGAALVVIASVRAAVLWSEAGARRAALTEEHQHHEEACDHTHDDCGHDHGHSHAHDHGHSHSHAQHDHGHSHAHAHAHSHSHGDHADHDHGWAPWRYVVLLLPIILFLLGLPSKGPAIQQQNVTVDLTEEALYGAALTSLAHNGWSQLGVIAKALYDQIEEEAIPRDFKQLEAMASSPAERDYWKGKTIKVKGQFMPQTDRLFTLVRLRIQCCAADAVQLNVPILSKDSITDIRREDWIVVTGRVDFREVNGTPKPLILVSRRSAVQPTTPGLNPYEQN
jgi:hypothetical protein